MKEIDERDDGSPGSTVYGRPTRRQWLCILFEVGTKAVIVVLVVLVSLHESTVRAITNIGVSSAIVESKFLSLKKIGQPSIVWSKQQI